MKSKHIAAGARGIPTDEMEVAADLYIALQGFFSRYKELQDRPLFITGESYAGKYVPSIGAPPTHSQFCSCIVRGILLVCTS